jgi:flagellar basal-body rod protein FlgB
MQILFDPTNQLLTQMIHGTGLRHRVLAANLANAETPGYQAQDVTFAAALEHAEQGRLRGTVPAVRMEATVAHDAEAAVRRDGNTVDLDRQMVKLTQNTGWHNAMVQILAGRLAMMKTAIRDRG